MLKNAVVLDNHRVFYYSPLCVVPIASLSATHIQTPIILKLSLDTEVVNKFPRSYRNAIGYKKFNFYSCWSGGSAVRNEDEATS